MSQNGLREHGFGCVCAARTGRAASPGATQLCDGSRTAVGEPRWRGRGCGGGSAGELRRTAPRGPLNGKRPEARQGRQRRIAASAPRLGRRERASWCGSVASEHETAARRRNGTTQRGERGVTPRRVSAGRVRDGGLAAARRLYSARRRYASAPWLCGKGQGSVQGCARCEGWRLGSSGRRGAARRHTRSRGRAESTGLLQTGGDRAPASNTRNASGAHARHAALPSAEMVCMQGTRRCKLRNGATRPGADRLPTRLQLAPHSSARAAPTPTVLGGAAPPAGGPGVSPMADEAAGRATSLVEPPRAAGSTHDRPSANPPPRPTQIHRTPMDPTTMIRHRGTSYGRGMAEGAADARRRSALTSCVCFSPPRNPRPSPS